MTVDDAFNYIVGTLKTNDRLFAHQGYDVYVPNVIRGYLEDEEHFRNHSWHDVVFQNRFETIAPLFYEALWELCRKGVMRPGHAQIQIHGEGNAGFGDGYAITTSGRKWLGSASAEEIACFIPGRFVSLLKPHAQRFGPGFLNRGAEAVHCYSSHLFLACCAMCGAAAESILLAIAGEQSSPEEALKIYLGPSGRKRLTDGIVNRSPIKRVKTDLPDRLSVLNYWRDEAAHGKVSTIGEEEAYTALLSLLRLARFADENFPASMAN